MPKSRQQQIAVGTVSHGTLRTEDLLYAFTCELASVSDVNANSELLVEAMAWIGHYVDGEDDIEAQHDILCALMDALDDLAPPGLRFGAHDGDGSDFGWWPVDDFDDGPDGEEPEGSDPVKPPSNHVPLYQVVVEYKAAPAFWAGATADADAARTQYASEAARISEGAIIKVVLLKDGTVVAVATS